MSSIENIAVDLWVDQIDRLFKSSYEKEAELIGVETLPPLDRSKDDLVKCGNCFFGYLIEKELCGAIELECKEVIGDRLITITSLAVAPAYFRQGIGKALVQFIFNRTDNHLYVTTGARNEPAIRLYEDLGFNLIERFNTPDGIAMVAFSTE